MKPTVFTSVLLLTSAALAHAAEGDTAAPPEIAEAAAELLAETIPDARRDELIERHKSRSADLLRRLVEGLEPGTPEELRRIPTVWRVTVAAGKRNDPAELAAVLDASLPAPGEPLREWQAVVIGGGVINGIGLAGDWPSSRIEAVLRARPDLRDRWNAAVGRSFRMADDEKVIPGTRYDALRILALADWAEARPVLERYLRHGNAELQQGAVSGLSDVRNDEAAALLLANIGGLTGPNRDLALDALVRDGDRVSLAEEAVRRGVLTRAEIEEARKRVESRK